MASTPGWAVVGSVMAGVSLLLLRFLWEDSAQYRRRLLVIGGGSVSASTTLWMGDRVSPVLGMRVSSGTGDRRPTRSAGVLSAVPVAIADNGGYW
jgi:hypothetical protein